MFLLKLIFSFAIGWNWDAYFADKYGSGDEICEYDSYDVCSRILGFTEEQLRQAYQLNGGKLSINVFVLTYEQHPT